MFQVSIKAGFVTHFSVEVSVPKQEGKYISKIKMDTDYEVSEVLLVTILHSNMTLLWLRVNNELYELLLVFFLSRSFIFLST